MSRDVATAIVEVAVDPPTAFEPSDGGTRVVVEHRGFDRDPAAHKTDDDWAALLDRFAERSRERVLLARLAEFVTAIAENDVEFFRRNMRRFRRRAGFDDFESLHAWSVEDPGAFWRDVWDTGGVVSPPGATAFDPGDGRIVDARFFPDAAVNLAENLLVGPSDDTLPAIVFEREDGQRRTLTWGQLRVSVSAVVAGLREAGVHPGDRVAAWMPNLPETVIAFLATNAIGAIFSSTSADFGTAGVVDRFGQIDPVVLFAADGYMLSPMRSHFPS